MGEVLEEASAALSAQAELVTLNGKQDSPNAIEAANDALEAASAGDDPEALERAIAQAEVAKVPEETLIEARENLAVLRELAQAKIDAEHNLAIAMASEHLAMLNIAIELAEETGVREEAITEAKEKQSALRQR